jgi:NAD(P)H-dependent FMN reductase
VDLADVNLPLLDESKHPRLREYAHAHTRAWSATVARADAFVVITPEYDFGPPASLVNALQYLLHEWAYTPVGFVSYGGVSAGSRSTNALRATLTSLKMMPMFESVAIPFFNQFVDKSTGGFDPGETQVKATKAMLDEMVRWTAALRILRRPA